MQVSTGKIKLWEDSMKDATEWIKLKKEALPLAKKLSRKRRRYAAKLIRSGMDQLEAFQKAEFELID